MSLDSNWFVEYVAGLDGRSEPDVGLAIRVTEKLYEEETPFQKIEIFQTPYFGKVLVFDGCVMLTERENFLYHEMMSHPALFCHKAPRQVAIIGGGDCGTLKEVLKHRSVEAVTQIEIDERVTRVCEIYFPELTSSNNDKRAQFVFDDGIEWMKQRKNGSLDVIIIDCTDPKDAALGLFHADFYAECRRALTHDGILVQQTESPLFHADFIKETRRNLKEGGFTEIKTLSYPQPCYPSGTWTATMAFSRPMSEAFRQQDVLNKPFKTKYYNADIHQAAFALPESLVALFEGLD